MRIITLLIVFLLVSCENQKELEEPPASIYKLKGDYANNVCVLLSEDRDEVIGSPDPWCNAGDTSKHPIALDSNYYFDYCCNYGINSAYLSITKEEFQTWYFEVPLDSYIYYILDADPYLEYYIDEDDIILMRKYNTDSFPDRESYLNYLIERDELGLYFKQIK